MASSVYFASIRSKSGQDSFLRKVGRLFDRVGTGDFISPGSLVAIKVHFGERGNTAYVKPIYIRQIVDRVKKLGANSFLTDTNTLYVGGRSNSVDHLNTAIRHGFDYSAVNAPLVIADGLRGRDFVTVPIDQKNLKEAKVARAIFEADSLIGVAHVHGHELLGFGACIKNIGMGCASRGGKQVMHSGLVPEIDRAKCQGCKECIKWCPAGAITIHNKIATIDPKKCIGCGECTISCPNKAVRIRWDESSERIQEKVAEYCLGALLNKRKKSTFFNFLIQVTPDCNCCPYSDTPIVPDIGILASRDPVAIDQAAIDLVNREPGNKNSLLKRNHKPGQDKFRGVNPEIDYQIIVRYGEEISLGSRKYELIEV